jgi:hypothetical protein
LPAEGTHETIAAWAVWEYDGRTVRMEAEVPEHAVAAVTVEFAVAAAR